MPCSSVSPFIFTSSSLFTVTSGVAITFSTESTINLASLVGLPSPSKSLQKKKKNYIWVFFFLTKSHFSSIDATYILILVTLAVSIKLLLLTALFTVQYQVPSVIFFMDNTVKISFVDIIPENKLF